MGMVPWRRKTLARLAAQAADGQGLRRSLSTPDLCLLGVGVVVGTGIFVLTGKAAALHAGPAVCLSLLAAAVAAGLGALCYAELATLIPAAGSVYSYSQAAWGELVAFVAGWVLVAEYTAGAATVAVGWSAYLAALLAGTLGVQLPGQLLAAPWAWRSELSGWAGSGAWANLPAAAVVLAVTALVARGGGGSVWLNRLLVLMKIGAIVTFVWVAGGAVEPHNWQPWLPANRGSWGAFGVSGVLEGAALLFFSYCGVEALSNATAEAVDPQRGLPIALMVTLAVCLALYLAVALVLTGVVRFAELSVADPLALAARRSASPWLEPAVAVAALAGMTSVMIVQIYCQPRVLFAMAEDGLLPGALAALHPRQRTPVLATWLTGSACALVAALVPVELIGELCSVATLTAFALVAAAVMRMRQLAPTAPRPFRLPGPAWAVPTATLLVCGLLAAAARPATLALLATIVVAAAAGYLAAWRRGARAPAPTP